MKLNLLGFIRFSGFSSSTKIPRRAQAATKPIRGSALGAATVNRATITAMPARHTCHKEAIRDSEQKCKSNFNAHNIKTIQEVLTINIIPFGSLYIIWIH